MSMNFVSFNTDAVYNGINLSYRQMPMNPLGNKDVERAINEETEELNRTKNVIDIGSKISESQKTDPDGQPQGNVPWSEIMEQLQLLCTGDEEEDFNNIVEEIGFQLKNAQTQYDYNYYKWLLEYTYRVFMSLEDAEEEYQEENQVEYYKIKDYNNINMRML